MDNQENFQPIDLFHIREKLLSVKHNLEIVDNPDRSPEMKKIAERDIKVIVEVVIRDIDYYLDRKTFNGKRAWGMED